MLVQLDGTAIGILDLDVTPGVDVNLLDTVCKDILGQEAVLGHFRVQGIHQFIGIHAVHGHTLILQIPSDTALDLLLGFLAALSDQGSISAGEIRLHLTEHFRKGHSLGLGCEEEVACFGSYLAFCKDGPSSVLLKGDVMHLGLFRLCLQRGDCCTGGKQ